VTPAPARVVIVGASAAGLAAATALRDEGYGGEIVLLGAEALPPYDRPPLSKKRLEPDAASALRGLVLADAAELARLDLDLRLGQAATALDTAARRLTLAGGATLAWDACILATGADPIRLPGEALVLRGLEDALAIGAALRRARAVVIVGAGVLGCELAALARGAGAAVTVVDTQAAPMLDKLGPLVAARVEALHRAAGVEFRFGAGVAAIEGSPAQGQRVTLADGSGLQADLVLVAIGCRPAVGWLAGSGVPLSNGVLCDAECRALPGVYAAGDVANWYNPRYRRHMRIEHRMNAAEQGMAAAANLLGAGRAFDPIPFFWTDQYAAKIQVHGLIGADCEAEVLADDPSSGGLLVAYSRNGVVEGVLGWNMIRQLRAARALVGQQRASAGTAV